MRLLPHAHGAWIGVAALALVACRSDRAAQADPDAGGPLLVVEDSGPVVVSGTDTTVVLAPTLFAWFTVDPDRLATSETGATGLERFRQTLQTAQPSLRSMGVRVVVGDEPARIVELPPGAPEGPPDPRPGSAFGYLFVDMRGHVRQLDEVTEAQTLACTAARTFALSAEGC